jgi:hypothetical protein
VVDRLQFLPLGGAAPDPGQVVARARLFGDMHFGYTSAGRLAAVADDLANLPEPDALLSVGDETHFGTPIEYTAAKDWLARWTQPLFYTVTGNHTYWNHAVMRRESCATLYQRFFDAWGLSMPYAWQLGNVRFIGAGPLASDGSPTGASLLPDQIAELADFLALAPSQPTVLVIHSPLYQTVLGDGGPPNSVYTSTDLGFYQTFSDLLLNVLAGAPQVALVITGHTHSPLKAQGLVSPIPVNGTIVPQFNAMALPFVRRDRLGGPRYDQDLVTWDLAITADSIVLSGRDHLARRDVAQAVVPLTRAASPAQPVA